MFSSGQRDYLQHRHRIYQESKKNTFDTHILSLPERSFVSIHDVFADHLSGVSKVEVLYSGGLDSECVLISCIVNKIPTTAITMRMLVQGCPINVHDLYYSTEFCRKYDIQQKIVDLDVESFFENGDHFRFLNPYYITEPHVATHMWLMERCSYFPIMGGDYAWPQETVFSPYRHNYSYYGEFMKDHHITGIGNMISHSIESNMMFVRAHREIITNHSTDPKHIGVFKQALAEKVGFGKRTLRMRSYGWENLPHFILNKGKYQVELFSRYGTTSNSISWDTDWLGGSERYNDKF